MSAPAFDLLVFRHAHAAKATPGQDDFDRPLDERGHREAAEIGAAARGLGLSPGAILCSPAKRTRETLAGTGGTLASAAAEYPAALYPGDADTYLAAVRQASEFGSVLLIGHNPGIADLASLLAEGGRGEPEALDRLAKGVPTAGLAVFAVEATSGDGEPLRARLRHFLVPAR